MSWPLSLKRAAKIKFPQYKCRTFLNIIYPADKNNSFGISSILTWGKSRVGLPPPFIAPNLSNRTVAHRFLQKFQLFNTCQYGQFELKRQLRSVIWGQFQTTAQLRTLFCRSCIKNSKSKFLGYYWPHKLIKVNLQLRALFCRSFRLKSENILSGCCFLYVFDKKR